MSKSVKRDNLGLCIGFHIASIWYPVTHAMLFSWIVCQTVWDPFSDYITMINYLCRLDVLIAHLSRHNMEFWLHSWFTFAPRKYKRSTLLDAVVSVNKLWNKQSICRWFETPTDSCDATVMFAHCVGQSELQCVGKLEWNLQCSNVQYDISCVSKLRFAQHGHSETMTRSILWVLHTWLWRCCFRENILCMSCHTSLEVWQYHRGMF